MHFEFCPSLVGTGQPQVAAVDACEFTGDVQTKTVAGDVLADGAAMKAFENVFLCLQRDGTARVADREKDLFTVRASRHTNATSWSIILPGVLQQVLHDDR